MGADGAGEHDDMAMALAWVLASGKKVKGRWGAAGAVVVRWGGKTI